MPRGYRDEDTTPPEADYEDFTLERFCRSKDGRIHVEQLIAGQDRSPWIHIMAARQSGKSQIDCAILFDNAKESEGSTNIFLGLKGTGVRFSMWQAVWLPLCQRFGIPDKCHNATNMVTTFPNGSRVAFAGTDDLTNVRKYLGNSFVRGVFIIDEAQSQGTTMLKYIIENLLPPTLGEGSRVYMTGVLPDVPAGYFYERARGNEYAKGWSHHEWGRAANIHTPNALEWLANHMREFNIPADDPQIRRDWYMERVWDANAGAYRYRPQIASWSPPRAGWSDSLVIEPGVFICANPPPGIDTFSIGTDPGTRDRWAFVLWGWNSRRRDVCYQIAEYVTPRNAKKSDGQRMDWSDAAQVADVFYAHYETIVRFFRDAGSSQETLDLFGRYIGRMVVKAANKQDLGAQVERMATMLQTGRLKVIAGSQLENDLKLAKWKIEARADGRYEWDDTSIHPDVADAGRYGLQGYIEPPADQIGPNLSGDAYLIWKEEQDWKNRDWKKEAEKAVVDPFERGF